MTSTSPTRIEVYSSHPWIGSGVSYTCQRVCEEIARSSEYRLTVHTPSSMPHVSSVRYRNALPRFADRHKLRRLKEHLHHSAYAGSVKGPNTLAYLWPRAPTELLRRVERAGAPVIVEMINCHVSTAKRIIHEAYARRGMSHTYINEELVENEIELLQRATCIFAPNPMVVASLRENDVPENKIIATSYGWDRHRFSPAADRQSHDDGMFHLLYVGSICIRKGVDTLVSAWKASGVRGKLTIVGDILPDMADQADVLRHETIDYKPFTSDISGIFATADAFVIPTLEEGGPMVTIEAAGAGLPIITTPMGAAGLVRDGENGLIAPPEDKDALVDAIRRLAADKDFRLRLGAQAARDAERFTWEVVGSRRAQELMARFGR